MDPQDIPTPDSENARPPLPTRPAHWVHPEADHAPIAPPPGPARRLPHITSGQWLGAGLIGAILLAVFVKGFGSSGSASPAIFSTISSNLMPPQAAKDGSGATSSSPNQAAAGGKTQAAPNTPWDRMIIRTAQLQVQVKDVGATMDTVRGLVTQYNGLVLTTSSNGSGPNATATLTIPVPSAEFDRVIPQLRHLASKVLSEQVSSEDVTEEYTDLQSQLRNLQATESRMLALQAKAEKIEDILTVDRELRSVQADIKRIQGRVNYLSKRSDMSTITLNLVPDSVPVPVAAPTGWDPASVATRAWYASLDLLANAANVAITVLVFLWWAIPLLLIAALVLRPRLRRTA
jgi:hypothetical protein